MVFMSVELVIHCIVQCLQSNPESHQNHFIEYTSGHLIQTTESQKKKQAKSLSDVVTPVTFTFHLLLTHSMKFSCKMIDFISMK